MSTKKKRLDNIEYVEGYLTDFSLERLLRFLNDLGQDVYISIVPCKMSFIDTVRSVIFFPQYTLRVQCIF